MVSYLNYALNPELRRHAVKMADEHLTPVLDQFDAFAITGKSGALMAGALAYRYDKQIILVRKEFELVRHGGSHADSIVEGCYVGPWLSPMRYFVLDDFSVSGETVRRIIAAIGASAVHTGTYLYRDEKLTLIERKELAAA